MRTKILLLFFFLFLFTISTTNAMEIAVIYEGNSLPNIVVDIYKDKDSRREEKYTYITESNGIINITLEEDYYWIEIDTDRKESRYNYIFSDEVYLKNTGINIIECDIDRGNTPGFELLVLLISIGITIYILRRKKDGRRN